MKLPFLLPLLAACAVLEAAEPPAKFDKLTDTSGTVYEKVTVVKVEPDCIRIEHANGLARVPFSKLTKEIQEAFNYSEAAAVVHQQAREKVEEETEIAFNEALREKNQKSREIAVKSANGKLDKGLDRKVEALAIRIKVKAFQNTTIGLLGEASEGKVIRWEEKPGSMANTIPVWEFAGPTSAIVSDVIAPTHSTSVDRFGIVDKSWNWDGKGWMIGNITYTTRLGEQRTVTHFTADKSKALEFYKELRK